MSRSFLPALGVLILLATAATAQEPKAVVPVKGSHAFRQILHNLGLQPLEEISALTKVEPKDTMVILFGAPGPLDDLGRVTGGLRKFAKDGGAILIATDRDTGPRLRPWRVGVPGAAVVDRPPHAYQNDSRCPIVETDQAPDHPLLRGLQQGLATNRPSFLQGPGEGLKVLARFAVGARVERSTFAFDQEPYAMASDEKVRERVLILAGHGVFFNVMMATNQDNMDFAWNCVRWLREGPEGPRKYALFIEEGKVASKFDVALTELPRIPMPPVRLVNQLIRGLEREGLPRRIVHSLFSREQILRVVLLGFTVWLVGYGGWRLLHARQRLDTAAPLLIAAPPKTEPEPLPVAQRQQAALREQNLGESARFLARHFLEINAGLSPPSAEQAQTADIPFQVRSSWWRQRSADRQFRTVWELAYHEFPDPISRRRYQQFVDLLDELSAALAEGTVQLSLPPKPAPHPRHRSAEGSI
jgi:hypothetical protein